MILLKNLREEFQFKERIEVVWFDEMERLSYGGGGRGVGNYGYENGVVMTRDPKPRLRWSADLHDRFVDAVTKLGGPDS